MEFTELVLAGITRDIQSVTDGFSYADAIAFHVSSQEEVSNLEKYSGELPVILTSWTNEDDSHYDNQGDLHFLKSAVDTDLVEAVDLEYELVKDNDSIIPSIQDDRLEIVISYRNHTETPDLSTLHSIINEAAEYGDIVYLETMASEQRDALTLLTALSEATQDGVVIGGACLGEVGRHTQVIASSYGSKLIYAPLTESKKTESLSQFSLKKVSELIQETEKTTTLHEKITNPMVREE
ncbi:type I 3-dehydroquinate dehydratase [Haloferax namakaokahaiae]|uniref:3-dehydroquinate dehydratase n=1 Tax=Haloferax namakaokahaiae TaxID=1748331 RepID=A0ABD5ZJ88_9EURY